MNGRVYGLSLMVAALYCFPRRVSLAGLTFSTGVATWPGTDTTPSHPNYADGMLSTQAQAAYYDRPVTVFGANQRSLCNKCHGQD